MYSTIYDLPAPVRNSLDEKDQMVWLRTYNSRDPKDQKGCRKAARDAWMACRELPSSFSFKIIASVDAVDIQREVIDIDSIKKNMDIYIDGGGPVNFHHSNYQVGTVYAWEPIKVDGMDGVAVYGNIYGHNEVSRNTRKAFVKGFNGMSIGGEAELGKYQCDERGCFVKRNVKETGLMEISLTPTPANKYCTLISYHDSDKVAKSGMRFMIDNYEIHRSSDVCPIMSLKKSLCAIGYDAHATAAGVIIPMSEEEFKRTEPYMKAHNLSAIWSDGSVLVNDRDYLTELSFKDGIAKGYLDRNGMLLSTITKDQFSMLIERDVLEHDDTGYHLRHC